MKSTIHILFLLCCLLTGCSKQVTYDVLIKNGTIVDGSGSKSYMGDVGINADTIAAIGKLNDVKGKLEIDATGLTVAPGFINMLS
ncbi:MAG: D-aminoacylase, partial [Flavobacteriaceae bacterium]